MVLIKVDKFGYMNVGDVTLASKKSKAQAFIKFYSELNGLCLKIIFMKKLLKVSFLMNIILIKVVCQFIKRIKMVKKYVLYFQERLKLDLSLLFLYKIRLIKKP